MKRVLPVLLAVLLCLAALAPAAQASTLTVGPGRITADQPIVPGHRVILPAHTVTNGLGRDIEVTVRISDHRDEERKLPPAEWFVIQPTQLYIPKDGSAEVQVTLELPKDAPPGPYAIWFNFHALPVGATGLVTTVALNALFAFDVKAVDHTVTLFVQGRGTVSPAAGAYTHHQGTRLELAARPAEGWRFSHWTGLPPGAGADTTHTVAGEAQITAVFQRRTYQLTVAEPQGEGTVSPAPGTYPYEYESEVRLAARPGALWKFDGWEGPVQETTSADTRLTVRGDAEVQTVFAPLQMERVTVRPSLLQLAPKDSRKVQLFAIYEDGTEREVTEGAVWRTADEDVATTAGGVVTARSPGETVLVAEYEGLVVELEVVVDEPATVIYLWVLLAALLAAGGLVVYRRRNNAR
ncbi:MAG: hypothetical protein Q8P22_08430 [Chloroflexota bacterium]|nr:hypothetical protein [Chloroflexota bacterium]